MSLIVVALALSAAASASAQFNPPSTVVGSISDPDGPFPEGVKVEAYIGDVQCGLGGKTLFYGDGADRITVYVVDVISESQRAGCGTEGKEVRIKIGDRFVDKTVRWTPGQVILNVAFGNATPVPIPTATPFPTRTPDPSTTQTPVATSAATSGPPQTIPAGSPGAGSPVPTSPRGGITSATPGQQAASAGDGGGTPFWIWALLGLSVIGAVGGGVGYFMARGRAAEADDGFIDGPD
ncbi:MAG: hypothetical protein AB7J35_22230 [Dehalococcoidia bacterium]